MTKPQYDTLFNRYLVLVSAFLLYVGIDDVRQHDRWGMGDWVTDYAGGFVRRGLTGQFALYLSNHSPHISIYAWTFMAQLACYGVMFGALLFLLRGLTWKLWMIAMVYSPATLSFTIFAPTFAFRKEILYLGLLAIIIVLLSIRKEQVNFIALFLTLSMLILVLSHEGMIFYYPYIFCAFLIVLRDIKKALVLCSPGAVVGACAFMAAYKHPGTLRIVRAICASLGGDDLSYEPCSGALVYMTKTASNAHLDVLQAASYWHFKLVTPFLLIMSLGPMMLGMIVLWRDKDRRFEWWSLAFCSGTAWLLTLVLFEYGFDWNRWIYVHLFSSLMLLLMIERQRQQVAPEVQRTILPRNTAARYTALVLLAVSMGGWQLSFYHHFPLPGENLGLYLRKRVKGLPMHQKLEWRPQAGLPHEEAAASS